MSYPKIELHAFEPDMANHERLRENAALNGSPTIQIHSEAVAAKAGKRLAPGNPGRRRRSG